MEGLVGLVICFVFNLSSLHVILFLNGLLNPPLWDLINLIDGDYHLSSDLYSYVKQILINFSEALDTLKRLRNLSGLPCSPLQLYLVIINQVAYPM